MMYNEYEVLKARNAITLKRSGPDEVTATINRGEICTLQEKVIQSEIEFHEQEIEALTTLLEDLKNT